MPTKASGTNSQAVSSRTSRTMACSSDSFGSTWPAGWFSIRWPWMCSSTRRKRWSRSITAATVKCGLQCMSAPGAGGGFRLARPASPKRKYASGCNLAKDCLMLRCRNIIAGRWRCGQIRPDVLSSHSVEARKRNGSVIEPPQTADLVLQSPVLMPARLDPGHFWIKAALPAWGSSCLTRACRTADDRSERGATDCFRGWGYQPRPPDQSPRAALVRVLNALDVVPIYGCLGHRSSVRRRSWLLRYSTPNFRGMTMSQYSKDIQEVAELRKPYGSAWNAINPEYAARMRAQNRFKTGLDIAKY